MALYGVIWETDEGLQSLNDTTRNSTVSCATPGTFCHQKSLSHYTAIQSSLWEQEGHFVGWETEDTPPLLSPEMSLIQGHPDAAQ